MRTRSEAEFAELEHTVAELRRELAASRSAYAERTAQQAATIDVLQAMSDSPADAQPVFDAIARRAKEFCQADGAAVILLHDGKLHLRGYTGFSGTAGQFYEAAFPRPVDNTTVVGRAIIARDAVYAPDIMADPDYGLKNVGAAASLRSSAAVPLSRDGMPIGAITIGRFTLGAFSDAQMELLRTFAEQAVIAITSAETYRALQARTANLREALEQQTATAEVLGIINASPGDLAPVFETILRHALHLTEADFGTLWTYDGTRQHIGATLGIPAALAEFRERTPDTALSSVSARMLVDRSTVHLLDIREGEGYLAGDPRARALADLGQARTLLVVPMVNDQTVVGSLQIYRQEIRAFTGRQIVLVENFAAQAAIAMENARLLDELRARSDELTERNSAYGERIAHQGATIDVLKAMSASPGDPQPVFDLIAQRARDICGGYGVSVFEYDGALMHLRAYTGVSENPAVRAAYEARFPMPPPPDVPSGRAILEGRTARIDIASGTITPRAERDGTVKSGVGVPMLRGTTVIGALGMGSRESGGFTDTQIELLRTFAEQAVIAITSAETYRALQTRTKDLQELLEQQTATAEILRVINASRGDLAPVFDTILAKAHALCGAELGSLGVFDGQYFRKVARYGYEGSADEFLSQPYPPSPRHEPLFRGAALHVPDVLDPGWEGRSEAMNAYAGSSGLRTWLEVPLWKDGTLLGTISGWRREPRPFSDKEISLLQNFAAQAVIAMENARLLTEQREALERQTATAEVLQVINANPGNLMPVFDAMLEKAALLCDAQYGSFFMIDGDTVHAVVTRGLPAEYHAELSAKGAIGPQSGVARVAHGEDVVHLPDMRLGRSYLAGEPFTVRTVDVFGTRTWLGVPLRKDGVALGLFAAGRFEVRPFTDRQIDLLKSFAEQAVIAMDNARLLREQREALERQTATAEVLQVINENPGNLEPVFETILEKALTLSEAAFGTLWTFDTENAAGRIAATRNIPPALAEFRAKHPPRAPSPLLAQVLSERRTIHQLDVRDAESYLSGHPSSRSVVEQGGARTLLLVPLLKDQTVLGNFQIYRQEVRAFTDRQISLVESFASQAVIAMDNARLLRGQREALERQTAMAEVLQVINANPGNLTPVFDVILAKAHAVCGADMGGLFLWNDTHYWLEASLNNSEDYKEFFGRPRPRGAGLVVKRLIEEPYHHVPDCQAITADISRAFGPEFAGRVVPARTSLSVALRKDGVTIGHITANRLEMRPYTSAEITLLESFAAQAVIAMDNARLLNEIRQRKSELDITFENMGDGVAMFDSERKLAAWNRNFQDILDLPDDAVRVGLPFDAYIRGLAERGEYGPDANADEQIARLAALLGQANRFERRRPDGRVIDVRQNPIPDGGFVIIYADITERKRAEEALRAARDDAETALRDLKIAQASLVQAEKMASLGQLTAGIAHEIKNPLNFVNNFAALSVELLDELKEVTAPALATLDDDARADADDLTGTLTSNLHKIEEHGKRADNIVRGMLEHSRASTGERRAVDLNELVEEALNLAYHGARARDQSFNITLERDYAAGIAPIEVAPQDLTRVFLNLFGNGFDAARARQKTAPAGFEPMLRASTRDHGDSVEIRVRDNGTGVPPKIRDKLFQPFFTTKPAGEGTGLGLSISYDIVTQQHGGSIVLHSEPNVFTEFTVTIPRGMASGQGGTP